MLIKKSWLSLLCVDLVIKLLDSLNAELPLFDLKEREQRVRRKAESKIS